MGIALSSNRSYIALSRGLRAYPQAGFTGTVEEHNISGINWSEVDELDSFDSKLYIGLNGNILVTDSSDATSVAWDVPVDNEPIQLPQNVATTFVVPEVDSGTASVTYSSVTSPAGTTTFDSTTRTATYTATAAVGTTGFVTFRAANATSSATYTKAYVIVAAVAPTWPQGATHTVEFNQNVSLDGTLLAMPAGSPAPTITATGTLPAGATLDLATLGWGGSATTLDETGSYVLTATNAVGTKTLTINWSVTRTPVRPAWNEYGAPLQEWIRNLATGQEYVAPDPGGLNPAPVLAATGLPAGRTFVPGTRTITSPPTVDGKGEAIITATQTPADGSEPYVIQYVVPWVVGPIVNPRFAAASGTAVILAHSYYCTVVLPTVADGYPTPTYTVSGQPAGMTLIFEDGVLTLEGKPTSNNTQGTMTITATYGSVSVTFTVAWQVRTASSSPYWVVETA